MALVGMGMHSGCTLGGKFLAQKFVGSPRVDDNGFPSHGSETHEGCQRPPGNWPNLGAWMTPEPLLLTTHRPLGF